MKLDHSTRKCIANSFDSINKTTWSYPVMQLLLFV